MAGFHIVRIIFFYLTIFYPGLSLKGQDSKLIKDLHIKKITGAEFVKDLKQRNTFLQSMHYSLNGLDRKLIKDLHKIIMTWTL